MLPYPHPACNTALLKPEGMTEAQCRDLPILREPDAVSSFWKPDEAELAALNDGGLILLRVTGHTHPPLYVSVCLRPTCDAANISPAVVITQDHWDNLITELEQLRAQVANIH